MNKIRSARGEKPNIHGQEQEACKTMEEEEEEEEFDFHPTKTKSSGSGIKNKEGEATRGGGDTIHVNK